MRPKKFKYVPPEDLEMIKLNYRTEVKKNNEDHWFEDKTKENKIS